MSKALAVLVSSLLLTGCVNTKLVGPYEKATCDGQDCRLTVPQVAVSLNSAASAATAKPPSFKDLSDRAMAEYVKAMADPKRSDGALQLRRNIAGAIKAPAPDVVLDDRSAMDRTIVVTVAKRTFNPSDRLVFTQVRIDIDNGLFANWSEAKTEYETYDLGTLETERKAGFEANADLITGEEGSSFLPKIGTKASTESTRGEKLAAKKRVEILTPEFSPKSIILTREGVMGIDLTGNTIVDLTVLPLPGSLVYSTRFSADGYRTANGWAKPEAVSLKAARVVEPRGVGAVTGQMYLTYVVRHVTKGDKTQEDRDDVVDYVERKLEPVQVTLVPAGETRIKAWGLKVVGGSHPDFELFVNRNAHPSSICFDSFEEAEDLMTFLDATSASQLGDSGLGLSVPDAGQATFLPLDKRSYPKFRVDSCLPGA